MTISNESRKLFEETLFEAEDAAIDTTGSTAEVADEIVDAIEKDSAGASTLSSDKADAIAAEVKSVADSTGIDKAAVDLPEDDILGVENRVTKVLDMALAVAQKNKNRKNKSGCNVLIIGMPGSGKTASIEDWAKFRGVNLVSVNAKNNDLEAYINGYTTKDLDNPRKVSQAFSDNLDDLDKDNSVLFLDEYNRQVKPHIRASLYTLINEHKIVGDGPNKQREFKNMLFTIAAINPAVKTDKGAAELNDAEKSRFWWTLEDMDSDPETTIEYLTKAYNKKINKLDPSKDTYREELEDYMRVQDLGIYIASHPRFAYDTRADLEDLSLPRGGISGNSTPNLLCQRSLTQGLHNADGDINRFKFWVENGARFLPRDEEMLLAILREYINPTFEDLCAGHGIDPTSSEPPRIVDEVKPEEKKPEGDITIGSDIEDDAEGFYTSEHEGKVRAKNPYEVELAISDAIKSW